MTRSEGTKLSNKYNVSKVAKHFIVLFVYHKGRKGNITVLKPFNDSFSMQSTQRAHCCTANCMHSAEGNSSVYRTVMSSVYWTVSEWDGEEVIPQFYNILVMWHGVSYLASLSLICLICKMVQYQPCRVIMKLDKILYVIYQIPSQELYK